MEYQTEIVSVTMPLGDEAFIELQMKGPLDKVCPLCGTELIPGDNNTRSRHCPDPSGHYSYHHMGPPVDAVESLFPEQPGKPYPFVPKSPELEHALKQVEAGQVFGRDEEPKRQHKPHYYDAQGDTFCEVCGQRMSIDAALDPPRPTEFCPGPPAEELSGGQPCEFCGFYHDPHDSACTTGPPPEEPEPCPHVKTIDFFDDKGNPVHGCAACGEVMPPAKVLPCPECGGKVFKLAGAWRCENSDWWSREPPEEPKEGK